MSLHDVAEEVRLRDLQGAAADRAAAHCDQCLAPGVQWLDHYWLCEEHRRAMLDRLRAEEYGECFHETYG